MKSENHFSLPRQAGSKIFRSAIIGLGSSSAGKGGAHSISYSHGWAHREIEEIDLVAACSRHQTNVDAFTAEFPGCRGYLDYQDMLATEKPDWVVVSAFARSREEMVLAAIRHGARIVWIEKPLALSLGSARRMMAAAKAAGVRLVVSHQRRYGQPFEWFREAGTRIGEVLGVDIVQPMPNLLNFGPHLIDAGLFVLGDKEHLRSVFGATDWSEPLVWHGTPHERHLLGCARFDSGIRMTIEAGSQQTNRLPILRVHGSEGFAEMHLSPKDGDGSVFRVFRAGTTKPESPSTSEHFHHGTNPNLYMSRAVADVNVAVRTGRPTRIDVDKAYLGLQILLGIYASAAAKRLLGPETLPDDWQLPSPPAA